MGDLISYLGIEWLTIAWAVAVNFPVWTMLGLLLAMPVVFVLLVVIPITLGGVVLESMGEPDPHWLLVWLTGMGCALMIAVLFVLFIGFVRFSWYVWA